MTAPAQRRRRPAITGRAAALAAVITMIVLALASPLRTWLGQQTQMQQLRAERTLLAQQITVLQAQEARWNDPAYVRQQASSRLYFVMPGQSLVVTIPPPHHSGPTSTRIAAVRVVDVPASGPWYQRLWATSVGAGRAG